MAKHPLTRDGGHSEISLPHPPHPRDPLLPHVPTQAGGEGLCRVGVGGPEREPASASRHHKVQAQAPKHNSGTSSHLDPAPMDLKRSTPGPPYPSSLIQGTMPFGAQHLNLSRHLTTLMDDTLDHLG